MKNTMMGLIDATTSFGDLRELTMVRALAAVPFGGRYRLIDFALSNMVNSGIQSVAIFPKYQFRSLMDHLGSGKNWDLNRKRDGLFFLPPPFNSQFDLTATAFHYFKYHKDYFYRSTQEYVVIARSNTVCNMNLKHVLDSHLQSGADVTQVCKNGASLNIYILKKSLLMDLIEYKEVDVHDTIGDILLNYSPKIHINNYEYEGYAVTINSINDYYRHSLELLQPEVMKHLFSKDTPIFTKVKDEPPTRYGKYATVKNSLIANGSIIDGYVENSIIFRGVKINKGAVVKNSIIMQKSKIEEDSILDGVILDKDVIIKKQVMLYGNEQSPVVIQKGSIQGALMNS